MGVWSIWGSEWYENQEKPIGNFRKLLQERIEKVNPRRKLTAEEYKRQTKLNTIADKLKRGKNVQNRQLQTWLSEDEYAQIEAEWQKQLELKDKPSGLKRYEEKLKQAKTAFNFLIQTLCFFMHILFTVTLCQL